MRFQRSNVFSAIARSAGVRAIGLSLFGILAVASGCTGGELDTGRAALMAQAAANRAIWDGAAIKDYEFVVQRTCFCGPDYLRALRIQVRGGAVSTVTFSDTGDTVTNSALGPFPTLDDLFDDLQDQILEADNVNATFDPQYGFPSHYIVDPQYTMADEEFGITVTGFRTLQ